MSLWVVGSSVAAKWFFPEEHTDAAETLLHAEHELHAPDFFLLELDNLFCKRIRRGEITEREGRDLRAAVRQVPVQLHPFADLADVGFELANQTRRSLYDCLYLALAVLLEAKMITADRRLYEALHPGPLAESVCWVTDLR